MEALCGNCNEGSTNERNSAWDPPSQAPLMAMREGRGDGYCGQTDLAVDPRLKGLSPGES